MSLYPGFPISTPSQAVSHSHPFRHTLYTHGTWLSIRPEVSGHPGPFVAGHDGLQYLLPDQYTPTATTAAPAHAAHFVDKLIISVYIAFASSLWDMAEVC